MDELQAILQASLQSLVEPFVVVPALAMGWWLGRRWMLLAGTQFIGFLRLGATFGDAPPDTPMLAPYLGAFVPPLLLALLARRVRRAMTGGALPSRTGPLPRLLVALSGMMLGAILGLALGCALGIAVLSIAGQPINATAEGIIIGFYFMMPGLVIGMVAGGIIAFRRSGRRTADAAG